MIINTIKKKSILANDMSYKSWVTKQGGNPAYLVVSVIGFTCGVYLTYRHFYAPWVLRKRLEEANSYAAVLYSHETKKQQ